jgi:hypothetical protein
VTENPTITVESIRALHVEVDGCCQHCSPCFAKVPGNIAEREGGCEGFPCDTLRSLERAVALNEANGLAYASQASIYGWSVVTGACGDCGRFDCHPGTCVVEREVCTLCSESTHTARTTTSQNGDDRTEVSRAEG